MQELRWQNKGVFISHDQYCLCSHMVVLQGACWWKDKLMQKVYEGDVSLCICKYGNLQSGPALLPDRIKLGI